MDGRAAAPGAGTILNALATGIGSAFAIDIETRATVELEPDADAVTGQISGEPDADTELIERCVQLVIDRFGDDEGAVVRTESDVPMAAGLKSSSAAANAAVLAACDALDVPIGDEGPIDRLDACLVGVAAARDAGVTVTGAFDDASASMLGGVTLTDNTTDTLRSRETVSWDVAVWTPPERAYSADADVDRCKRIAPMARLAEELASAGRYTEAMTINGLAFSAALGFQPDATVDVLDRAAGVSLSGTGPSVVAVGAAEAIDAVESVWGGRDGTLIRTETRTHGARTL